MTHREPPSRESGAENALLDEAIRWCLRMNGEEADRHRAAFETWLALGGVHREIYSQISELYGFGERLQGMDIDRIPAKEVSKSACVGGVAAASATKGRRAVLVGLAGFALVFGSWQIWSAARSPAALQEQSWTPLQSLVGEIRTVRLEDGSTLTLDTDSKVETAFDQRVRRVRMTRGRARIQVVSEARPFTVQALATHITAHDTLFDISLDAGDAVEVTPLRGFVTVAPGNLGAVMRPAILTRLTTGAVAQFRPGLPMMVVHRPGGAAALTRWPQALEAFDGARLADVVRRANRYTRIKILLSDPRLGERRFYGTLRMTDTRQLARILAHAFALKMTVTQSRIVLSPE